LTSNSKFPDTSDAFGRLNIAQGLEEGIMHFALSCWWYNRWSTQWPMHKFVSGFKERRRVLEIARGSMSRVYMKL
jgi:hypothetical protein